MTLYKCFYINNLISSLCVSWIEISTSIFWKETEATEMKYFGQNRIANKANKWLSKDSVIWLKEQGSFHCSMSP